MKTYKIELTEKELWKLIIFLIQQEETPKKQSEKYEELAKDESFSDKSKETFKSNADYFKEMYETIHEIRIKLDSIPF